MYPTALMTRWSLRAATNESAASAVTPIGFSKKIGTSARTAATSTSPRANGGVQMKIASRPGQSILAGLSTATPLWCRATSSLARCPSMSHATTSVAPSVAAAFARSHPIRPQPTTAKRRGRVWLTFLVRWPLARLETFARTACPGDVETSADQSAVVVSVSESDHVVPVLTEINAALTGRSGHEPPIPFAQRERKSSDQHELLDADRKVDGPQRPTKRPCHIRDQLHGPQIPVQKCCGQAFTVESDRRSVRSRGQP